MTAPGFIHHLTIGHKLRLAIVGATVVALLLAGALVGRVAANWSEAEARRELTALAAVARQPAITALERNDAAAGVNTANALGENLALRVVVIYRADAGILGLFRRAAADALPAQPLPAPGFHARQLELVLPLHSPAGAPLGSMFLRADPARQRALVRGGVGAVALAGLLGVGAALGFAGWLERRLTGPVRTLVETAERVRMEENFAVRAPATSADELGRLANAFNDMLAQIQLRDVELRRHRDHLGELVAQRTAELMELNHTLFQARDKAEDASRAKSSFLANMSHELRTPLNAIKGYSEMLMEEAEAEGRTGALADLRKIHTSGQHLLALINEVLDLSKIEAGKMTMHLEDFDLVALVREVFDAVRPQAVKNQTRLELETQLAALPMRSDHTKVRQTLANLVSNAVKFTERGEVRLRVATEEAAGHPWVEVTVSDTGVGMSEPQLARLFQAFEQADAATTRKFGGTGLGLALSRRFTEALGGTLTVTSTPGRGSVFTLRLPARPLPPPALPQPAAPAALTTTPPGAPMVLVIDDDANSRDLMVRFLQKEGFSPHTAADGRQGLLLARQLRPALITLDVMMPGVDGWSVLAELKADPMLADIPVMMLTMTEERDRGFTLGASEFLTKPIDFPRLASLLREYCPQPGDRPILVVEDDEISRHILRRNLEKEGYPVVLATNGREALEVIRLRLPAIILLDLMMPEMDGFAFAQAVRGRRDMRDVPIIVLTAKDLTEEDRQRLTGSVAGILQKQTLSAESLQSELRAALARHLPPKPEK